LYACRCGAEERGLDRMAQTAVEYTMFVGDGTLGYN
jgi:hypothetical protein